MREQGQQMHAIDSSHISAIKVLGSRDTHMGVTLLLFLYHFWLYLTLLPEPWAAT